MPFRSQLCRVVTPPCPCLVLARITRDFPSVPPLRLVPEPLRVEIVRGPGHGRVEGAHACEGLRTRDGREEARKGEGEGGWEEVGGGSGVRRVRDTRHARGGRARQA